MAQVFIPIFLKMAQVQIIIYKQIKTICKFLIENSNRQITDIEKELLKTAVDQSHNWQELILTMMMANR